MKDENTNKLQSQQQLEHKALINYSKQQKQK